MITITHDDIIARVNDASHDTCSHIIAYAHMFISNMFFDVDCDDDATCLTLRAFDNETMRATIDELRHVCMTFVARDNVERDAHKCAQSLIDIMNAKNATHH
jgi:hypothetical protein